MNINEATGVCGCCGEIVSGVTCEQCVECGHLNVPDETEAPFAVFAYDWPEVGRMFTVFGGPSHRSTVTAETLNSLGITIPSERSL